MEGLHEESRRPRHNPNQTPSETEDLILSLRHKHMAWGGRKICARLLRLGYRNIPAPSTITAILKRHGLVLVEESERREHWQRFEHPYPNSLWQLDFKGKEQLGNGMPCYSLTMLDDHSRFNLLLKACNNMCRETVKEHLTDSFRMYGLPDRLNIDNGAPWGSREKEWRYTRINVWFIRLGIRVSHSRPCHPQTNGKEERFHRTLCEEVFKLQRPYDFMSCQKQFDEWRSIYNNERPHEALNMAVPADRYQRSIRELPEKLPPVEYDSRETIRKVHSGGRIAYQGRFFRVGRGFSDQLVAIRPTDIDGVVEIYFCQQKIKTINLKESTPESVTYVPEQV